MDTCSQGYANLPCPPPPHHGLPFSGFDVVFLMGFAVAMIALGLIIRYRVTHAD